jgi:hypothetical protein
MRLPAALLSFVLLLAACAAPAASPAPATSPPPESAAASETPTESTAAPSAGSSSGVLLTLGYRGGHCRAGPCDRTLAIDRDGGISVVAPEPQELGTLSAELFNEVREQLSLTDFEELGSQPFTGECPVNFDGQELIYTFHGATGEIRLASCKVELDPAHPLLVAIENAFASVAVP